MMMCLVILTVAMPTTTLEGREAKSREMKGGKTTILISWIKPGRYINTISETRTKQRANNALMRGGCHCEPSFPFIIADFRI